MFIANAMPDQPSPRAKLMAALSEAGRAEAMKLMALCPMHAPTPLRSLPALAGRLGIASLHIKDEGSRLGLGSFKALGGAYAVMRLVLEAANAGLGHSIDPAALQSSVVRAIAATITVCCATDGNHGRSVAAGARIAGCRSVIFMHEGVSEARMAAIAAFGATIVRVAGTYDDSVAEATRRAAAEGWLVVSDTSWEGYEDIPLTVMQGYTIMAGEAFDAVREPPTHMFLQAGVGGMAAAVIAHAVAVHGQATPRCVIVEPERAACLFASAQAGQCVTIPHSETTVMAMLECLEPSRIAWDIIAPLAAGFATLGEQEALDAMRLLAFPTGDDPAIVAGESGGTGVAGLIACLNDPAAREALALGPAARVLLFNTEGATDPALYKTYVGVSPDQIAA